MKVPGFFSIKMNSPHVFTLAIAGFVCPRKVEGMRLPFYALTPLLILFFGGVAQAGGGWVSGGGGGLVCFSSRAEARKALDSKGRLRNESFAKVKSVQAFDLFDQARAGAFARLSDEVMRYLAPREAIDRASFGILNEAIFEATHEIGFPEVVPWLFQRQMAPFAISDSLYQWRLSEERLALIDDRGESRAVPAECVYVQIAHRRGERQGDDALVSVTIDFPLWLRLDPLSKVALLVHEWVYTITSLGGKNTSLEARELTAYLLREATQHSVRADARSAKREFQDRLMRAGLNNAYRFGFGLRGGERANRIRALDRLGQKLAHAQSLPLTKRSEWLRENLSSREAYLFVVATAFRKGHEAKEKLPTHLDATVILMAADPATIEATIENGDAGLLVGEPEYCASLLESEQFFLKPSLWRLLRTQATPFCRLYLPEEK